MDQTFMYRDIQEFQKKHPGKEERMKVLVTLPDVEIYHLARSCGNATTAACFMQFVKQARRKEETEKKEREES